MMDWRDNATQIKHDFVDGLLMAAEDSRTDDSAVMSDSWGRFLLQIYRRRVD